MRACPRDYSTQGSLHLVCVDLLQRQVAIVQWLGIERELLRGETKPGTLMTSFRHEIEDVACYLLGLIDFCHMS